MSVDTTLAHFQEEYPFSSARVYLLNFKLVIFPASSPRSSLLLSTRTEFSSSEMGVTRDHLKHAH